MSVRVGETKVSFPVSLFTNPVMLLNLLKFFKPQFTHFLNGDNNDCFIGLLWDLNEIIYVVHQVQSATHK